MIEVARILLKEGGEHSMAENVTEETVPIEGGVTLAVSCRSVPVALEGVVCLFNACTKSSSDEATWIERLANGEGVLLFRGQRYCIVDVARVKVGHKAKHSLSFGGLDLSVGYLRIVSSYLYFGGAGTDWQSDCRGDISLIVVTIYLTHHTFERNFDSWTAKATRTH